MTVMRCPDCNVEMKPDYAYDPVVWKCKECKCEVEEDGNEEVVFTPV
jgi:hypothetical protein